MDIRTFNMAFADIVGFMNPGVLGEIMAGDMGVQVTGQIMLVFAVILEIPIAMILLSRVLRYKANRLLNIIAAAITILFVIGGGSLDVSYIFFASVEVISLLVVIWLAWKWTEAEA